jgi:tRNA-2-methylthio-N6-dimethylallyladenosine synthase
MTKRLFIETVGCQMNVLDTELLVTDLIKAGYERVESHRQADLILFNTCSVRAHAEDKIYSALGRLKHIKEHRPTVVVGVLGCMAQKDQALIFRRAPWVDLVVGPSQLGRLPGLVELVAAGGGQQLEVSLDRSSDRYAKVKESFSPFDPPRDVQSRPAAHQAMVRIMFGCDQFCTYCIVPSVRGPEQSRSPEVIEREVRRLASQAMECEVALEVTLLGQTVNGYRYKDPDSRHVTDLAQLLQRLNEIEGLSRIKFVSSHPRFMTDELILAVRDLPRVSPYLHVPAQSGSDRMLKRMRRGYTDQEYREMIAKIYETIPDAAITSDFIVGFCGETDDDFGKTVDLVRDARFKNSFIFKYSTRSGTRAAEQFEDDIPNSLKRQRNNDLLAVQNKISEEDNRRFASKQVEILVEGPSKTSVRLDQKGSTIQMVGRTACDRIVVFDGPESLTGRLVEVEIERTSPFTLFGRLPNLQSR